MDIDKLLEDQGHVRPEPPEPKRAATLKEMLALMVSRVVLGAILCTAFFIGFWTAGVGLHDPDTCWLLALGRYMYESGHLPATDVFSWSFADTGRRFIQYQWLSELVFYWATRPAELLSLLMLTAVALVTAFLSLPLNIAVRRRADLIAAFGVCLLVFASASFHTLVRPEIFSFFFLAISLQVFHHARTAAFRNLPIFPFTLILVPVMALWANMHTGFIGGVSMTLAGFIGTIIGLLLARRLVPADKHPELNIDTQPAFFKQMAMAFVASTLATLINPFGFALWAYIPDLFFNPINRMIQELKPVTLFSAESIIFYPFYLLSLIATIQLIVRIRRAIAAHRAGKLTRGEIVELSIATLVIVIATICGIKARRLITFSVLFIAGEIFALMGLDRLKEKEPEEKSELSLRRLIDQHVLDLWRAGGPFEPAILAFCAMAAVSLCTSRFVTPTLPAGTSTPTGFKPPVKAIAWLKALPDDAASGQKVWPRRMLNDQQYGDMVIWDLRARPKVFFDTRFDMYGQQLVENAQTMLQALNGWESLMERYDFDCVFVRADSPLAAALKSNMKWEIVYKDDLAVILKKSEAH